MNDKLDYPQITQDQLEVWLNNPVTKTYLQSLYFSHSQEKEAIGNGSCLNKESMERSFAAMNEAEGIKSGLTAAMDVVGLLNKHVLLEQAEDRAEVVMPDLENIIGTI